MPPELRRAPPRPTLDWVAAQFGPGARVTAVQRLHNAWAAAVHAVEVEDERGERHRVVLRRWARTDLPPDPGVVENEAKVLGVLAAARHDAPRAASLYTPELVAADPDADDADVPALVMTRLPGHDVVAPLDLDPYLDGLVAALHEVHAVDVTGRALGAYRPFGLEAVPGPRVSERRELWARGLELARRPLPDAPLVLCHHDFHPGNVLWHDGHVSGVVDWTHACRGPAAADVAHCRLNLAVLFGLDVADDFARRYGPVDHLPWFDLADVAGFGPPQVWRWHDAGRTDITAEGLAATFEEFLAAALDRLE